MANESFFNVLSNEYRSNYDEINDIAATIRSTGASRAERRRIQKMICRQTKLTERAQKRAQDSVNKDAYEHYKNVTDRDMVYFFAMLGLTMIEDYHWYEKDNDHGQISSLFDRVQAKMRKYEKLDLKELTKKFYDESEIILVSNQQEFDEESEKE